MIKKRNLDSSLIQWIMTVTGLGPGIGEMFWVAPSTSSTSQFRTHLENDLGVSDTIYSSPATAYAATVACRNDAVLVMPGAYALTSELAWAHDWTHMIGLGGPNTQGDYSLVGVSIYTATANVAETIDCTGDRCQFQNLSIGNWYNDADNLAAFNLDGWGCYFKNVSFDGAAAGTTQADKAEAAALYIDRLGHFPIFENCVIGTNNWTSRTLTAHGGSLRFVGTSEPRPQNGQFRDCKFQLRADGASYSHAVVMPGNHCIGWLWLFERCHFHNYYENNATDMSFVFGDGAADTHSVLLDQCSMQGFNEWQSADYGDAYFGVSMAAPSTAGGIVVNPTAAS